MNSEFQLLPERASSIAGPVDMLMLVLVAITLFFTFLIAGVIILFIVRYRRRAPLQVGATIPSSTWLEVTWTVIPLAIAMFIFVWATSLFVRLSASPPNATEIDVVGKQWMWKLQHPGGKQEINELHVPRGRPIRLVMTSQDVVHSFFIPAFRIKQDVLPGRYSTQWFIATAPGEYHLLCSQYCGTWHSHMVGRVIVMEPADYDHWLDGTFAGGDRAKAGAALFESYGCSSCHGQQAPTLSGLYSSIVTLDDGSTTKADDNYLRESILDSQAKVVAGYRHIMPSYRGQLTEQQLRDLLAYIKSLQPSGKEQVP